MRNRVLVLAFAALCLARWHTPALAQTPNAAAVANDVLLINAGFESGKFKDVGNGVSGSAPQGWTAFWVNKPGKKKVPWDPMNDSGILPPEYKPVDTQPPYLKPPRVRSGNWAASWFAFWKVMDAGLYQQVAVPPGQKLRFSAWAHAWSNSGSGAISGTHANDPYWSDGTGVGSNAFFELADPAWPYRGASALDDAARNMLLQVGIDPAGGTDALAPSVVWGPGAHIYNGYHEVPAVEAVAQGGTITVFLRARNLWGFMHNDVYWDDPVLTLTENCSQSVPLGNWKGEYFPNTSLSGDPTLVSDDGVGFLSFDWGRGGPGVCGIGTDHFSVRWTRTVNFAAGTYRFNTRTDDGVRLYIDDALRIDKWIDRAVPAVPDSVDVALTGGNHTLRMEYYENGGLASVELTWQAIINHPPTAVATANPTSGPAPLAVAFSGTGSSDPDGDALSYAWSFGDGAQGTGATASHTYSARGSYTATLTVNDGRGGSNSASVAVTVTNRPPTAVATANPTSGPAPLTVAFSGTGSSDPDGDALSYAWSFGDGTQGTGATVSHTYAARGSYTATLTVDDSHGGSNSASVAVSVGNRSPNAVATANPTSGPAPLTVAFNGTGSSDPDGDALSYAWSFGDGAQGTGASVSHTYSVAGSYTATLTVDDGHGGTSTASAVITVLGAAGPLVNGDFESSTPGSALGTGWIAFSSSGYAPTFAVVSPPDPVHGGSFAQRVTSPQPRSDEQFAGIYQVISTTPGVQYTVRAWNRTHFTGGIAWDHIARLGIDTKGGNDFQAPSVQWLEFDSAKDSWHPLEVVVTAGASMTIYLESWRKWASGGDSLTWFDDVQVGPNSPPPANHPPTAMATASPTSGVAPLTVAFSGAGSTDPDGDPLTYAWSFGDGAQGSGVSISHTYSSAGTYHATLTVDDGRGGTHSAEVVIVVDPPSGNRPPIAVISANPKSATIPFTVTLDGRGSSDPDGDPLTYSWRFADGVQGSGPTMQRTFVDANGDTQEAGGYLVTLTVSDGKGGTASASVRIGVFLPDCPPSLDFDAIRAQLAAQGQDLEFVKIGFHTGGGGILTGLGKWERCLDAAGVPFTLKQVPAAQNASVGEAADLRARSGVPHTAIYRRCCEDYELPACAVAGDWNSCPDAIAEQEAHAHWLRHLRAFPREVVDNKQWVWVETINEPWKGDNTRNNAEWLAKFSYYTALDAMAAGYNYAAFGWSSGEPEYGPPPGALSPSYQWDGPEMQNFLRLAAQHPDRIAISLHEYNYWDPSLRASSPSLVGRFQRLFERCDAHGIGRPTVLITEFGWPYPPSAGEVMAPDNVPWAAGLYARFPQVKGAAMWDAGGMGAIISKMTAYALQNYFAVPRSLRSNRVGQPVAVIRGLRTAGADQP